MEVAGAVRRLWSRPVALSLTLACAAAPLTLAQEARLFVSSRAGDRLTEKPAVRFAPAMSGPATFRLDPSVTHQTIVGFGASFLEAGMVCLNSLEPVQQEARDPLRVVPHRQMAPPPRGEPPGVRGQPGR